MSLTAKILLVAGLALGLLISVLLLNSVLFRSRQIQVSPVDPVKLDGPELARRLGGALQFPTVSNADFQSFDGEAFLRLHAFLEESYPLLHAQLQKEVVNDYSLLYSWRGSDPTRKPILLMAHIDVVSVEAATENQWTHPPFSGATAEGFVWGRGALDIKSGALAILEAVEQLASQGFRPNRDIHLALGHDEEVGGVRGNQAIAALLTERGVRFEYVLDEGGVIVHDVIPGVAAPVAYVAIAEKGYYGLQLTGKALGGHSSMPPRQSAIGTVAKAIYTLETHSFSADLGGVTGRMLDFLGPEMPFWARLVLGNRWLFAPLIRRQFERSPAMNATMRTTTAVTMVGGGVSRNVLPTAAWAVVNFRIMPGQTSKDVLTRARSLLDPGIELEQSGFTSEPSRISDVTSEAFGTLHTTIVEVFPDVVVTPALAVVTTDSRHYEAIAENTFRFIPTRMGPRDLSRPHGIDERISVENYVEMVRFFIQLIRNSGG